MVKFTREDLQQARVEMKRGVRQLRVELEAHGMIPALLENCLIICDVVESYVDAADEFEARP